MAQSKSSEFGKKLESAMAEMKMSPAKLCGRLKWAVPQFYQTRKTIRPREATIIQLSKVLKKPLEYWAVGSGSKTKKVISQKEGLEKMRSPGSAGQSTKIGKKPQLEVYLQVEQGGMVILRQKL